MNYRQPFSGEYPITQRFGEKITDPKGHTGIDYACPASTPILASEAGQVFYSGWREGGYGYCVFIKHSDGNVTIYEHMLFPLSVIVGERVERGQVIGYSGSTGAHLHFEVRDADGKPFDPMKLPLMSYVDLPPVKLKEADALGESVKIVAPLGAWGWNGDFSKRWTVFPNNTSLHFTGKTTERLGYTYCEVYPEPVKYWVAIHDKSTQILDNE